MLAPVMTAMSRSPSANVLLSGGDGVLGTHKFSAPTRSIRRRSVRLGRAGAASARSAQ